MHNNEFIDFFTSFTTLNDLSLHLILPVLITTGFFLACKHTLIFLLAYNNRYSLYLGKVLHSIVHLASGQTDRQFLTCEAQDFGIHKSLYQGTGMIKYGKVGDHE